MQTVTNIPFLSGSADGEPIPVAATATPGTLLHTVAAGSTGCDQVWLWASNVTGANATLTIQWGGVADPSDHLCKAVTLPPNSVPHLICAGVPLSNGKEIRAFSGTANAINITGYANRVAS